MTRYDYTIKPEEIKFESQTASWPVVTKYKYKEDEIIREFHAYIDKTYGQHYMTEEQNIECFDVWLALGDSMPTFRNTAIKYLWRLGKKGNYEDEIKDVMKVMHYCVMILHVLKNNQKM